MAKDNLSSLYNGLINKGYSTEDIGDEATFRSMMADKKHRKQLYDYVSARKDFRIGDYETYENRLSMQPEQTETEQEPQEVKQKPLPKAERKTLQEQAGMNIAVPDAVDMAAKFAEGQTYDPNANIQKALARGELDTIINQDEEKRISAEFTPKPVVEASDIYKNYYDRFGLTERGKQLSGELATIQEGVQKKYADEFLASDDYKKLSETYTGAELDEAANTLFAEKYSGKIEEELKPYYDAYRNEALSRYQNEIGQEFEQFQKAQTAKTKDEIASDVSSLTSSISQQKEDIHNRLTAKAGTGGNAMSAIMGSRKYIQETESDRKAQAELNAAQQLMDESNNIIAEAKKKGKTNFVAGLGRGLSDAIFDANTWSFGLQELRDNTLLLNALNKYDNGEQLTESEQTLMDAAVANMATNAYFYSDLGRGYKAGTVSGQSIPFMLEFAINPVSASGSAIAKSILKYGMQKFGKSAVKNNASKFAARLIGDMAAAGLMTGTTSAARVGAGAVERMTGDIQLDDTGTEYAGRENVMSAGEAIGKSAASTFLENQSEMVFNAFKGLGNKIWKTVENQMPGGIAGVMDNAILGKVGDIYRKAKSNPVLQEVARRTQFHGLAEEYLEEVYNNFANIPLGEMTLEEATDLDNNIDTFLGLAPTSVAFAALGLGGLAVEKNEHRKRIKAALGNLSRIESKRLAELERMAETAGNEDIKRFIRETITSTELTPEEKKAEIDYAYNLAVGNAIDQLETEQKNETLESHAAATEEGRAIYAEHNPQTMRETVLRREIAEQRLAATGMTQDDISVLANTPVEERYNAISSFDTDRRKAAEYYFAAKDRETALNDALDEAHAEEVTQARELLDSIVLPNGTVTIVPLGASATNDTEYGVVVSGIDAEGNPTQSNGAVMVYPVKLNNGQLDVDMQTPMTIVPKSYTDAVIYSPDEALESMLKSYSDDAAILDGIPMTVGAQFPIMDDNGMMSNVTILGIDQQNGRYIVSLNDQIDKNGVPRNTYVDAAELAERKKNAELAPFMQEQIAEEQQRMEAEHEAITTDLAPQVANLQPQPGEKIMIAGKQAAIKEVAPDGLIVDYINESGDITGTDIVPLDAYYNYKQEQFNAQENERQNISDVSEQSGNVNDTEKNAGEQSPEPQGKAEQPYPTDERGEPAFTQMQPEQTISLLTSTLADDASSFVADKLSEAEKSAKKAAEKKPKSLSFTERINELGKIAEEKAKAESELQYWQNISAMMNVQPAQPTAKKEEPKKPQPQAKSITEEAEEITRKNQERLAAMTEEEIAAAQKKVQENIDKGKYDRPTQRKRTRYVEQDKELGYAVTPYENVLREIATGAVTFKWSDMGATEGLGSHLGVSGSIAERQKLIWALSNDGYAPEVAAEVIHANMPENLQGMVTDQDVFNMILDAFGTYGSPSKMFEAAKEMHGTDEISMQRGYEEDMERQALEWEAEQNKMSVNDWTTYLDVVEDVVEMKFGTLSDEDINTIFDGIINEINNENERGETEGRSSETTEQPGDTETGNEVLSGQQADNATAGTESTGQEQQTETDEQGSGILPEQTGYVIDKRFHKKDNKDIYAVNFTERMDRQDFLAAKQKAKEMGGYYSSFGKGGFIFDTEDKARNFAESILNVNKDTTQQAIENARKEVDTNPTEAQKEAGNYRKGHVTVDGYNITIENPKGSERKGTDKDGNAWSVTMNNDYGYIRGTEGVDGDHIDVFLSDTPESGNVYVVDQINEDGSFDEHKVMYGFDTRADAEEAYLANYSPGWKGLGNITEVTKEQFKKWIESSQRKTKPFAEYKSIVTPKKSDEVINMLRNDEWSEISTVETPAYGSQNKVVSTARYEELKKKMRNKLNNLNAGYDPELIAIGAEMAAYHIEAGARTFIDFAKRMITDMGDDIRPYLKSIYSSARHFPGMEEYKKSMTPESEYDEIDINSIKLEEDRQTETDKTPVKKTSAKGNMQKTDNSKGFGDLFSGVNEVSLQTETLNRTDNEQERGSETENTGVGETARQEDGRADRAGMDSGSTGSVGTEQPGSGRNAGVSSGKSTGSTAGKTEPQIKNTRNNRNERGIDYAPRSPKARFAANVKAIKLMRQLMNSGEQPTREQMEVLRRYSGWGGMGTYFNNTDTEENKQLRELLTDEEYDAAANSGNSAYYTPAQITDSLWDIVEKLGFKGGNILESSAGIGNILGAMPQSISEKSNIHAVEIDKTSGNILSLLYPDAKVDIQGFEDTRIRNGSVDLAITNVPFVADLTVYDKIDKDLSAKFPKIQDFCIAKNVRKLREGGLGVFITSSITMDNSANLREWLVNEGNADFIGAFRLNNKTFEGADVTTDIIVVRKRTGKKVSPVAIDALKSTVERTGSYDTKEAEWNKKERRWEPVKKDVVLEYNTYYQQHPENMGGEMFFGYEKGNTYRPGTQGLYPVAGKNQNELLKNWVNSFTPIMDASYQPQQVQEIETEEKNGTLFADKEGNFFISDMGVGVPLNLNANKIKGYDKTECLNDYNAIKTSLNDVLEYQINNQDDKGLQPLLDKLNEAYDTFVGKYGSLNKNTAISFLKNDVDFPSIAALEDYKEYKNAQEEKVIDIRKTNVFDGRVIGFQTEPEPKDVKDGVIASIYKNGYIDVPYIAEKLGKSVDQVEAEILKEKIGFVNPVSGAIEVRYEYLSGNVRQKLEEAKANNTNGEYNTNIAELEKVIPMDIPAHLIDFSLGSSWIDPKLYIEYIQDRYGVSGVSLNHVEGAWNLIVRGGVFNEKNRAAGVYSEMFKETVYATDLVAAALNNRTVQVKKVIKGDKTKETLYDREATQACVQRIEEIKDDFKEWMRNRLQQDEELAAQVTRTYNDKFNNMVPKEIDDMFLPERFGGASQFINLYTHQKRAVIKGTTQPLLLAHEVGSGKTFTLISTAMEMRRLGTAKKPMIVVQNATVAQFVADAKKVYPNAKVLTITERDRTPEGRREFYGRIKYSDWDMIIIPQSTFEMIPDSPERQLTFIQERIEEKQHAIEMMQETGVDENQLMQAERELENIQIEMAELTERLRSGEGPAPKTKKKDAKREEKVKQNVAARAKKQLDRRTDEVQYFDEMGVDAILIDEAHEYKRLGFSTAMTRGVKGIDPAGSKKAAGVYLKTRAVLEKNGWKNVVFATGTPISNTAAEIWTFMRYLMPKDMLKANEIYYFDDFVRNFGSISQSLEFTTSGKFKENTRFASYINKPELIRLWATVSDTVLTKEIGYANSKIPSLEKGIHQDVFLPQSDSLISTMNAVRERLEEFEKMSGKEKRKNSHIPLTMYGIAKRAAIDTRLVDANAPDEPLSKTNKAVEETLKSLEETKDYKGTVAIFCDNQRRWDGPRVGFDLFEDIKAKLIEKGVPENQIVIMKPGMSIQKKQKIFDDVNAGTVRVVIGNTQTLGTGVNIQERLHTLIHMDAPDRPMDYTQRNGRILRQGNLHKVWNKPVRILRFGVEDSLDVTSYQRLKTKAAFIDSIMNGKSALANNQENRTLEEEEEGLFDNPVAILSGSQYALLKNAAERELRKYVNNKKRWEADQIYVVNRLARNKGLTVKAQQKIDDNEQQLAKVKALFPDGKVNTLTYNKKKLTTAESVDEAFKEINKAVKAMDETARKDRYFPDTTLPFEMELDGNKLVMKVTLSRSEEYDYKQKATLIKVRRNLSFDMPAMGIKDYSVMGAYARNILEYVEENIVTGTEFTDVIEVQQASIEAMTEESKLLEQRKGKPFEFDKELEEAQKKVDEYTELMKAEMKEKEAKYAGRGSKNVDLSTVESEEEQDEAQTEDEVRFRIEDEAEPGKFTEEEQSIIDEAKSNGTYMKAPNGKSTNLNEKQWAQVRTKAFKDWFGDWEDSPESASKVVDENGEPMVVYHGGPAGITQFVNPKDIDKKYAGRHSAVLNRKNQMGIYFIDKKSVAEQYAETYGKKRNIYPVFINARNIQDINQPQFYGLQFLKNIAKLWNKDFINYQDIKESDVEKLQSVGVDGLSAKSWDKSREFVVFNSNQIKSATENVGTFSNENNDIRFRTIDDVQESELSDKLSRLIYKTPVKSNPFYNVNNVNLILYNMSGPYMRRLPKPGERRVLTEGNIDIEHAKNVYKKIRPVLNELRKELLSMIPDATIPARKEITSYIHAIDNNISYYKELSEGKDVWRTRPLYRFVQEQQEASRYQPVIDAIQAEAGKLGIKVNVYTSMDEVPAGAARRAIEKGLRVKGWYQNGQINIYLPNAAGMEDVKATLLHEGVAHYGLRQLVGEQNFNEFIGKLYAQASKEVREGVMKLAPKYGYNIYEAMEEYIASMAEKGIDNPTFWQTVKKLFRDMLEKIGIKLDITDNDLRYLLWESRNNLRESANPLSVAKETTMRKKLGIGMFGKEPTEETRFRFEDRPQIIQQYDETIKSNAFRFQEAFQDSMLALKELQTLIENFSGKKIRTFENAYTAENRLSSVNKQDNEKYMKKYFEPLVEQIKKLSGSASREEVEDYIYAKSGLERNEVFLKRDADKAFNESKKELDAKLDKGDLTQDQYDALIKIAEADYQKAMSEPRDYSGLEGLVLKARQDELEGLDEKERAKKEKEIAKEYKQHAENVVSEFEAKIPASETARLWQLINDATNETLRIQFDSGMISGERYDELKGMMKYYVPLKSWSEQIAEDVYEYTRREAPVQKEKAAKGRKSLAANPIANIALSAQNAIILGNRNKMKQRFFNFVINRPNPLATVGDVWYAKTIHTVHDQVEPVYPDINETDGAEEIQQKLEDFENEMKELEERGMAFRRKVPMGVELVMKKFQKPEHMVQVMINGQEYVIYINGNPRAAQAINGKTNPEGEENIFWEYYNKAKRLYGGGLTSNNPDFVIANFVRDSIHSATMEFMNNGLIASLNFLKNVPSSVKTVSRGVTGIYDSSNQMDVYFKEFVENGGETGYTAIHTLEDYKKEYEKLLQEVKGAKKALKAGKKSLDAVISVLETANRIAEDINRFNAYLSSRQAGKTIEESIDAAKNITVNFNKKGSLSKGSGAWAALAWFMNKWILFFNPAVQGLYQVGQAAKKNKRRVQGTLGAVMASGFIMPYINSLLISAFGGGDDDDYFNQTDYTRMNNWLLFTGDGYVKIPLPPFFREWYGLGDILHRMLTGRMTPEKATVATARQLQSLIGFINLIPSGEPSIAEAVAGLMPDLVAPLMDVALNRDFTGRDIAKDAEYTKNLPEYERIYRGVSPVYVSVSKMLNEIGGDEARRSPYFGTFINPAYMEHLVTSYTGGIGKTISNVVGMAADAVTGETDNIEFRTVPVANRFYAPVTDRTVTSAINRIFYEYQDRYEAARVAEKRYKEFVKDGRKEFRKELDQMKKNGEADFISYFGAKMKILRKKQDRLRDNPDDKRLEEEIRELKSQMIMRSKKLLE